MAASNLNDQEMFPATVSVQAPRDVEMEDLRTEINDKATPKHFTVAIDFGTTFSSVSFIALNSPETERRIHPNQVCSVEHYPYAPSLYYEQRREVPTESWYPRTILRSNVVDDEQLDLSPELI